MLLFGFNSPKLLAQGCEVTPSRQVMDCSSGSVTFQVTNLANLNSLSTGNVQGFTGTITPTLGTGAVTVSGVTFTNYKGYGSFNVIFGYTTGVQCTVEVKIAECCQSGAPTYLFIDDFVPVATYSGTIWFYGDNTLEDGVVFDQAEVQGGTDARLILDRGAEVTFDETILSRLCEYRWDGIYASYSDNILNMINNSQLEDALIGIYAENNALIDISNSEFVDNVTSLKIEDYTTAGTLYGTHIHIDNTNFSHTYLPSSFEQHPSSPIDMAKHFVTGCSSASNYLAPIFILNSIEIGIGHRLYGTNNFTSVGQDITYITVVNSYTRIRNNYFDANVENAVCSTTQSKVVFGGLNVTAGNDIGSRVISFNSTEFFQNNDIKGGVEINTPYYQAISVGYTDATNFEGGNTIRNCHLVVNGNSAQTQVRVNGNTFRNSTAFFEDVQGVSSPALRSVIFNDNNMINPGGAATYNQLTIFNCSEAVVGNNTITNLRYTPNGMSTGPYGMDLEELPDGQVTANTITSFERGIYLAGNFGSTQFQCNILSDNYNGFYLYYPILSDQGDLTTSPFTPNYNEWYSSINYDIAGGVSTPYIFDWYYNDFSGASPQFKPSYTGTNIQMPLSTTGTFSCAGITIPQFKMANNNSERTESPFDESEIVQNGLVGKSKLKVYPVPTSDLLHIEFPTRLTDDEYIITDLNGRIVMNEKIIHKDIHINVLSWPQGVYLLKTNKEVIRIIKL